MYKDVDVKVFVEKWTEASKNGYNKQWIADKTGLSYWDVSNLKTSLYNKGVQFPPLKLGKESFLGEITVAELNKLIEDLLAK